MRGSKGLGQLLSQLVAPVTTLKFPGEQEVHTETSFSELEEERVEWWKVGRCWLGEMRKMVEWEVQLGLREVWLHFAYKF